MRGKISETLENDCLACYLHKNLSKIHLDDNHSIIIDVLHKNSYPL